MPAIRTRSWQQQRLSTIRKLLHAFVLLFCGVAAAPISLANSHALRVWATLGYLWTRPTSPSRFDSQCEVTWNAVPLEVTAKKEPSLFRRLACLDLRQRPLSGKGE